MPLKLSPELEAILLAQASKVVACQIPVVLDESPKVQGKSKKKTKRTKRYQPSEKEIQQQCMEWLSMKRILHWRQNSGGFEDSQEHFYKFTSLDGIGDIVGLLPPSGRFFSVEVKTTKGKVRASQKAFMDCVNTQGGLAFVVRSVDELIDVIEQELNQTEKHQ